MTVFAKHARRALMAAALCALVVPASTASAQMPPAAGQGGSAASPTTPDSNKVSTKAVAPAAGNELTDAIPSYSPLGAHLQQEVGISRKPTAFDVRIQGQTSLVHVGLGDSFSLTEEGINAGKLMLEGLEHPNSDKIDLAKIKQARDLWEKLIPLENFGGEYGALAWFADYIMGGEKEHKELASDPFLQKFFELYHEEDWKGLKEFLVRKYHIREMGDEWTKDGQRRKADLELTILFNNPRREQWDHTNEALRAMKVKPGMEIADVGSGAGYYSIKMAKLVGDTGKVYAIDTEEDRVAYVDDLCKRMNLKNVVNVQTDGSGLALNGKKVDLAIMVSLYHVIYAKSTARERNLLMTDIRNSLKSDGRLVIVDNNVVTPGIVPYHGPYIAKELVAAQIVNYGFKLVAMYEYIPQRYVLEFQRDDATKVQAPNEALAAYQIAEKIKKGEIKGVVPPVSFASKVTLATPNQPEPEKKADTPAVKADPAKVDPGKVEPAKAEPAKAVEKKP
jgi:ubiquinone/menaquinone biosynthesis C-methylase UbiE